VSEQALEPDPDLDRQLSFFLEPTPRPAAAPNPWSGVTCPECGGPLRQEDASTPVRFECQAGHGWSPESLLVAQAAGIERALWAAVLRLEERAQLHQVLAETAEHQGYPISATGFRASALSARSSARKIRNLLESPGEVGIAGTSGYGD
jgi:two-component system, chemotaxis family, protein-glutamate methylesterase/glutaminase